MWRDWQFQIDHFNLSLTHAINPSSPVLPLARKNLLSCILRSAQLWRLRMAVVLRPLWGKIHQNPHWWFINTVYCYYSLVQVSGLTTKPTFFSERVVLAVLYKWRTATTTRPLFSTIHPYPITGKIFEPSQRTLALSTCGSQAHWTWTWWKSQTKPMLDS